jgi:ParB/RepB/Spo0J family partition protein
VNYKLVEIPPDQIVSTHEEGTIGAPPSAEEIASIKEIGLLQPIKVLQIADNQYRLIFGNRRLAAWRASGRPGPIPALVDTIELKTPYEQALIENNLRGDNPASEVEAVQWLQSEGMSKAQIAASTKIKAVTLQKLIDLGTVNPELLSAYRQGRYARTVLNSIARCGPDVQQEIANRFRGTGKITATMVETVKKEFEPIDTTVLDDIFDGPQEWFDRAIRELWSQAVTKGISREAFINGATAVSEVGQ